MKTEKLADKMEQNKNRKWKNCKTRNVIQLIYVIFLFLPSQVTKIGNQMNLPDLDFILNFRPIGLLATDYYKIFVYFFK